MPPDGADRDRARKLSDHGDPFHVAFYHHLLAAADASVAPMRFIRWQPGTVEFPVELRGKEARVDIVLPGESGGGTYFIVGECKAVSGEHTDCWLFANPSGVRSRTGAAPVVFEVVRKDDNDDIYVRAFRSTDPGACSFGCSLRAKTHRGKDLNMEAVEGAARQVLFGANGLVEHIAAHPTKQTADLRDQPAIIIPAIFTTANLRVSDYDFAAADVESGEIRADEFSSIEVDWLLYTYPGSALLTHSVERRYKGGTFNSPDLKTPPTDLHMFAEQHYYRTIAVVTPSGVPAFLDRCEDLGGW